MSSPPSAPEKDPIRPWYEAIEALGDYGSFQLGHVDAERRVRWHDCPHKEFDGIGGFANLFREAGIEMAELPQNRHPAKQSWLPFVRSLPALLGPRRRLEWAHLEQGEPLPAGPLPLPHLAWHLYSEDESSALRKLAKSRGVTLNTLLLKFLDQVIRRDLQDPSADVPWMLPVNLRGQVKARRDTQNQTSYLAIQIGAEDSVRDLHQDIHTRLERGEHWAAWKGYSATRYLPMALRKWALVHDRAMTQWNLGLFTNLGSWDDSP